MSAGVKSFNVNLFDFRVVYSLRIWCIKGLYFGIEQETMAAVAAHLVLVGNH